MSLPEWREAIDKELTKFEKNLPKLSHFFVLEIATSYKSFSFLHVCIWILDRGRFLSIFLRSKSLCKCLRLINSKCFYYILCFAICITWHCWLCLTLLHLLAFQVPFSNSSWCCLLPVVFIMHYCLFQLLITILILAVSIVYVLGWISFFFLAWKTAGLILAVQRSNMYWSD